MLGAFFLSENDKLALNSNRVIPPFLLLVLIQIISLILHKSSHGAQVIEG